MRSSATLVGGESTGAAAPQWVYIQLNRKQYQFVQNWQVGQYSLTSLDAFMDSLQKRLSHIKL